MQHPPTDHSSRVFGGHPGLDCQASQGAQGRRSHQHSILYTGQPGTSWPRHAPWLLSSTTRLCCKPCQSASLLSDIARSSVLSQVCVPDKYSLQLHVSGQPVHAALALECCAVLLIIDACLQPCYMVSAAFAAPGLLVCIPLHHSIMGRFMTCSNAAGCPDKERL